MPATRPSPLLGPFTGSLTWSTPDDLLRHRSGPRRSPGRDDASRPQRAVWGCLLAATTCRGSTRSSASMRLTASTTPAEIRRACGGRSCTSTQAMSMRSRRSRRGWFAHPRSDPCRGPAWRLVLARDAASRGCSLSTTVPRQERRRSFCDRRLGAMETGRLRPSIVIGAGRCGSTARCGTPGAVGVAHRGSTPARSTRAGA